MKIGPKDYQLILELQKDGTISYAELAKRMQITPQTVAKRLECLKKSNTIALRAIPNPFKLGFCANALLGIKADPRRVAHICRELGESFYVNNIMTVFGRFEIMAIVYFPKWEMLHQFLNVEVSKIKGVIHVETFLVAEVLKRYDRFFEKEPYHQGPLKLKKIDWQLIYELVKDGRAPSNDLAEKLGIHVATVYRRISALLKEQIIRICAVPNPSRLNHNANAFVTLKAASDKLPAICKRLYPYPQVHHMMTIIGGSGLIVCLQTEDHETLYNFIQQKIASLNGIIHIESLVRAMVQKTYYYAWIIDENGARDAA